MTIREREDRFIQSLERQWGRKINPESEQLLRFGFFAGAEEMSSDAFEDGVARQRDLGLRTIGAVSRFAR